MAKPVAGKISYDSTADRPRVDLRVGSKKLLTEDDSTGGSITSITSTGGTVTITNPTGPVVNIEATAGDITAVTAGTGLTGGGTSGAVSLAADFGSAAGKVTQGNDSRLSDSRAPNGAAGGDLGGTYPNPTVEALGTTGTAVNVGSAAPGTAGQVLTLTDATHGTWQDGVQNLLNEYWCRDSTISYGALTEECTGSLNAGWSVKEWSTWNAVTNGGAVDSTSAPAANNYKITTNARRSWLMVQPAPSGTGVDLAVLLGSFTYAAGGFQFRFRFTSGIITDGSTTNGVSRIYITKDNSGNPSVADNLFAGYSSVNPQTFVVGDTVGSGTTVRNTYTVATAATLSMNDFELIIVGSGAAGTITMDAYIRGPTGTRCISTTANIGVTVGNTLRLVWRVTSTNSKVNIYAMDYLRQYPDLKITP